MQAESLSGTHLRDSFRYIAEMSGLDVKNTGDYVGFITDPRQVDYNFILGVGTKEESFLPLVEDFQDKKIPFIWFSDPLTQTIDRDLTQKGLAQLGPLIAVVCDLTQDLPLVEVNSGVSLVPVTTQALFSIWCEIHAAVSNRSLRLGKKFFGGLSGRSSQESRMQLFLAEKDDTYVGCSALDVQGDIAGCYWDAVLPDWRRQGIGLTMARKRQEIARVQGCSLVVAQCLLSSLGIFKQVGFQEQNPMALYKWGAPPG